MLVNTILAQQSKHFEVFPAFQVFGRQVPDKNIYLNFFLGFNSA
jgi:hypothetical protein